MEKSGIFALSYIYFIMNTEIFDGLERLARVYCWPNDPTIADKDKYEFRALSEFVFFNVYVKKPFVYKSLSLSVLAGDLIGIK